MIIILSSKNTRRSISPGMAASWLVLTFLLVYFIKSPRLAAESAMSGLRTCAVGLIPSLFPFLVLMGIINSSGLPEFLSRVLGKFAARLFGVSAPSVYPIIIGAVGGFPTGAVCVRRLFDDGIIEKDEAERLLAFTSSASPAFCMGVVGMTLFADISFGVTLYICQISAALVIALLTRPKAPPARKASPIPRQKSILTIAVDAIGEGGITMLKICSFAVFFAVTGDALCMVTDRFFGEYAAALCASFVELTLASGKCAHMDGMGARILCSFAVGWSGLSVYMQTAYVLSGSRIKLRKYAVGKLVQGILTALLVGVILWLRQYR